MCVCTRLRKPNSYRPRHLSPEIPTPLAPAEASCSKGCPPDVSGFLKQWNSCTWVHKAPTPLATRQCGRPAVLAGGGLASRSCCLVCWSCHWLRVRARWVCLPPPQTMRQGEEPHVLRSTVVRERIGGASRCRRSTRLLAEAPPASALFRHSKIAYAALRALRMPFVPRASATVSRGAKNTDGHAGAVQPAQPSRIALCNLHSFALRAQTNGAVYAMLGITGGQTGPPASAAAMALHTGVNPDTSRAGPLVLLGPAGTRRHVHHVAMAVPGPRTAA